jgi:hypothetical protein
MQEESEWTPRARTAFFAMSRAWLRGTLRGVMVRAAIRIGLDPEGPAIEAAAERIGPMTSVAIAYPTPGGYGEPVLVATVGGNLDDVADAVIRSLWDDRPELFAPPWPARRRRGREPGPTWTD